MPSNKTVANVDLATDKKVDIPFQVVMKPGENPNSRTQALIASRSSAAHTLTMDRFLFP